MTDIEWYVYTHTLPVSMPGGENLWRELVLVQVQSDPSSLLLHCDSNARDLLPRQVVKSSPRFYYLILPRPIL